ncbi:MAG: hypothetical protein FWG72_02295 [Oscillospiraceae bacterium]|nr:hypothetical protein [Oscillospiraceae bacterium]
MVFVALINCPECQKEISDKSPACVGCGFPIVQPVDELYKLTLDHREIRPSVAAEFDRYLMDVMGVWENDDAYSKLYSMLVALDDFPQVILENISYEDAIATQSKIESFGGRTSIYRMSERVVKKDIAGVAKCPTCSSTKLKQIGAANKVGAAALFGVLTVSHVGKTFKCGDCGYSW